MEAIVMCRLDNFFPGREQLHHRGDYLIDHAMGLTGSGNNGTNKLHIIFVLLYVQFEMNRWCGFGEW